MTMFRALLIFLVAGMIPSFAEVMADQPTSRAVEVRVGTTGLTKEYVSENHILQRMGIEGSRGAKVTEMGDTAIYRALLAGKIDLGSVFALPADVGIKDFDAAFSTKPEVMTLGHLAVSACVSSKWPIRQLTVEQVGRVVSGEITDWRQLGAGEGKINVVADQRSVDLIAALTGVKPVANIRKIDAGMKALEIAGEDGLVLTSWKLHELDFSRMERVALVPVAAGATDKPILPSLASIRDGSYPLARPWRLIRRPGASEQAAKVMAMLADVEKGGAFDPWLRLWLVLPGNSPIPGHIRIGSTGWQDELAAAAKAYQKQHPEVTITFSNDYLNVPGRLLRGEIDLANYTGRFMDHITGPDFEKWSKDCPEPFTERTVGYWPLAVAVHPGNPMASITMVQLQRLMTDPNARWADIGRPTDGRIRLYLRDSGAVQSAIAGYDFVTNSNNGPSRASREEQMAFARAWDRHRVGTSPSDDGIPDLTDDPNGIAIWYHGKKLAASGYKILPVVAGSEHRAWTPTDTAAVASGAYPLRKPLTVCVRPSASVHVKAFVEWLSTPAAAAAFKSAAEDHSAARWPVAHVSEAIKTHSSMPGAPHSATSPAAGGFDGTIAGAVAICPIQPLSTVFRMADRSHHAAYEKAIDDAIEADGRLKVVDRTLLSRVLDERRLQILGLDDAPAKPIVSADVLVISYVVTENLKTFLRIRAIHAPTGGVLSELKLPIDPATPATFDPPLEKSVRRWWPEVLGRLRDSRLKPSWVVLDVYPLSLDQLKPADAIREALQSSLAADRSIFAPGDSALDDAQQEMLLRILGLASPTGGRFSPAADFIVDARLLEGGKLEVRLRNAALKVLAEETFSGDADLLHPAATAWLKRQIAANPHRPTAATLPADVTDDWARRQARAELEIARKLCARAGWRYDKSRQRWDVPLTTPANPEESSALRTAANRHARRAAQLDPTNEEAAYEAIPTLLGLMESWTAGDENAISLPTYVAPLERFLQAFPRSKHYEEILYRHAAACVYTGSRDKFPVGTDAAVRLALIRRGLESYARYMELYRIKGTPSPDYQAIMCFAHYLYHLQTYITVADPSDKELEAIVADWSRRFDSHLDKTVHSDFVRLLVLNHKKDRAGFIERLTKMQQRWPDPKHPQWEQNISKVNELIANLFQDVSSSNSSFYLWTRGLRGIGDIPKVGYKPQDDKLRYRSFLAFACPQEVARVKDAIRQAGEAYKKEQPGVSLGFLGVPHTLLQAVERHHALTMILGRVPAEDLKALKELYRGGNLPLRRIGYFRGPGNAASQEVSILLPSGGLTEGPLSDFLRFLKTPEGQKALADHGVYPSADASTSQPATQPAQATTPLGKTPPGE